MSSTDFIQAKASTSPSLQNTTAMPGKITKIQVVTGSGKTARAVTIKAGTTSTIGDMVSITSPTTSMDMTFDFGKTNYTYFCLSTPGNACYFDKIVVFYEEAKPLDRIEVTGTPESFFVGDEFNHVGMTVTAYYEGDENGEDVTAWATFSTPDMTIAGEKTVTVTYGDKEASYKINVQAVVLTSVEVSGTPEKTDYFVGESFNPAGLTVTGHYNNGTQATITEGIEWLIDPEQFEEAGENISVDVLASVGTITSAVYQVTGLTVTPATSAYTLTAEPAEGGSYTVTVGDDPAVDVTTEAKQFMVTEGTVIQVEATAAEHYQFNKFTGSYADETEITFDANGSPNKKKFTYKTADATITANFRQMYAVNIDKNIEHGTVTADKPEATASTGITLTLTPDAHYHFESVTVKDKNGDDITLKEGPTTTEGITTAKFEMPAAEAKKGAVSVTATFAEDAKYTVTFSIIGRLESKSNYAGEQVEFPEVSNVGDYTFMGWTTTAIPSTQQEAPKFVNEEDAVYPENNNTLYYAVFAEKAGSENYVKVTSVTDGQYLIVNEASSRAFNGLDAASDYVDVEIENDEIADPKGAAILEIKAMAGGYYLKITNGEKADNYIYGKSGSNTIEYGNEAVANEITISDGATTILSNSTSFRYNAASGNDRFRYYKTSTTGASYILPALYKKQEATFSNYCTTVSGQTVPVTVNPIGKASFCSTVDLDFPKTDDVKAYIAVSADNEKITLNRRYKIPAGTGIFVLGTGGNYNIPIATGVLDDVSGNMLTGTLVPYTVKENDNIYALSKTDGKLYHIPSGRTIGAGKAYLNEPLNSASLSLFIVDEPTGINSINENVNENENLYNLQGMRVSTPKKGEVYIMNGKKFLMK